MSYDPMLTREMSEIDFHRSARAVRGQINGLNPWPCASIPLREGRLKLMRAQETDGEGDPGALLASDSRQGLVIACGTGAVRVLELQAPGGRVMRAEDYLRGHDLTKELCS